MRRVIFFPCLALVRPACLGLEIEPTEIVDEAADRVIFGDPGSDWHDATVMRWVGATAMLGEKSICDELEGTDYCFLRRRAATFGDQAGEDGPINLCAGEISAEEQTIVGAKCTTFFVGEDLFVTASHCLPGSQEPQMEPLECAEARVVFGYHTSTIDTESGDAAIPTSVSQRHDVYECKEVIARSPTFLHDWVVFRVARPVTGRALEHGASCRLDLRFHTAPGAGPYALDKLGFLPEQAQGRTEGER